MAVTAKWFGRTLMNALGGSAGGGAADVDLLSDVLRVILVASTATPSQDDWAYFGDVTGELSTASGYTALGASLTNKTLTYTASTNVIALDADDVSWSSATIQARYAVVYDSTASGSPLLSYVDFGETVSSTNGTFQITWNSGGISTITPA